MNPQNTLPRLLPFLLAAAFASLGLVFHLSIDTQLGWAEIFAQWGFYAVVLLGVWQLNAYLGTYSLPFIVGCNFVNIFVWGSVAAWLFQMPIYTLAYARFGMPSFIFLVLHQYLRFVKEANRLLIENLQLKAEHYKAESEQLKKQLNPHFLFNALTTLQTAIRDNTTLAENYVIKLAELYRSVLQHTHSDKITLREELNLLEAYIFLQQTRFGTGLHTEIQIEETAMQHCIPTFALQTVVENCIKHNILSEQQPLHIRIYQTGPESICVANNLQPKRQPSLGTGLGLSNLKRRYELLGMPEGLEVKRSPKEYQIKLSLL